MSAAEPMVQVLVRMPAPMLAALRCLAADEDRAIAAEVRRAVKNHLAASVYCASCGGPCRDES